MVAPATHPTLAVVEGVLALHPKHSLHSKVAKPVHHVELAALHSEKEAAQDGEKHP